MADHQLTIAEREILLKAVEGNYEAFKTLQKQIDHLRVMKRRKEYWTYLVEFERNDTWLEALNETDAYMEISDTRLRIFESEAEFFVPVKIMFGCIRWISIGGDYSFEKDFTVKEIYWENRNPDPERDSKLVFDSKLRNFKTAISYMPMYR